MLATLSFVACTESNIDIQSPNSDTSNDIIQSEELALTVGFEGDDTRIGLDEACKTVWHKGDLVTLIYPNKNYYQWQFQGETGDRSGTIKPVGEGVSNTGTIVVLYPYRDDYTYSLNSVLATIEATQSYAANSYGEGGNILVATQQGTSNSGSMMLRSVYGWLKLQLTGDNQLIKSIRVKGNNNEVVAGQASFNIYSATNAKFLSSSTTTELTLDCGDGVMLQRTKPTAFYIGFVPQTFQGGITVEIEDTEGHIMTKSTTKSVAIARNTIQPMSTFVFSPVIPEEPEEVEAMYPANDQIWYNVSNGTSHTFSVAQPFDISYTANRFGDACANGTCYNFYAISFDDEVTAVNAMAFKDSYLTSVYLPHSVTTIGNGAFFGSTKLREAHLGANITTIGDYAFTNCNNLQALYIRATTPPSLGDQALVMELNGAYSYIGCIIYVPASAVDTYKSHPDWAKYADYIRAYDFIAGEEPGSGGNVDDDSRSDFNHRLLLLDHTGVNCGYCPNATDRLHALANSEYKNYYNEVQIHGSISYAPSGVDPAYSDAAKIVDQYYAPSGYPHITYNFLYKKKISYGDSDDEFLNTMAGVFNSQRKKLGADAGIAINSTLKSSTMSVDINVKSAKAQEYNIAVWVLENNIYSPSQNGATSELHKTYQHALRYIATNHTRYDISGNYLGEIGVGEVREASYIIPLDSSWDNSNLEVLVIVSAANDSGNFEVVNTAVCPAGSSKGYEYISDLENGGDNSGGNSGGNTGGDDDDDTIIDGGDDSNAIALTSFTKGNYNDTYGFVQYTAANDDGYVIQLYINISAHELTQSGWSIIVGDLNPCSLNYISSKSMSGNTGYFHAEVLYNDKKKSILEEGGGTLVYLNNKLTLNINYSDGTTETFVHNAN